MRLSKPRILPNGQRPNVAKPAPKVAYGVKKYTRTPPQNKPRPRPQPAHRMEPIPIGDIMIEIPTITKDQIVPEKTRQEAWDRRQVTMQRLGKITDPFNRYREILEGCFIRYHMSIGQVGTIRSLPVQSPAHSNQGHIEAAGPRERIKYRVAAAKEVFDLYLAGEIEDNLVDTDYYKTYINSPPVDKILKRIESAVAVLRRFEASGSFVGSAPDGKYYPSDFPQVIDYWGYQKDLDGTHRRMVMHYLGHDTVPSLVLYAEKLSKNDLPQGYIRNGWQWFVNEFKWKAGLPITQNEVSEELDELGSWYQCIDVGSGRIIHADSTQLITGRTEDMLPFLLDELRPDDTVLDIGCNAGLYTVLAAANCHRAIGVDVAERFIRQACWVRRQWEKTHKQKSKAEFRVLDIQNNLSLVDSCTVLLIPKIFHHKKFNAGKIHEFMDHVSCGRARVVLLQGHKQRGEYGQEAFLDKILKKYGFSTEIVIREHDNDFPLIIGRRDL